MTDSEFTLIRVTNNTGPITMGTTGTATTITWMNIGGSGGTGTIIATITIEIMIGTATGIDMLLFRITNWLSAAREVRDLFRRVTPLGLKRLVISRAKLWMKAKRLDLRATFFISSCGFVLSEAMGPLRFINWTGGVCGEGGLHGAASSGGSTIPLYAPRDPR
jgi:hypothetical protein